MKISLITSSLLCFLFMSSCQTNKFSATTLQRDTQLSLEEKRSLLQARQQAFQAFGAKIRDPFILRGPDDYYYLTGTTAGSHWGDTIGIHLWKSKDLIDWEDLGFVWELYQDGTKQNSWQVNRPITESRKKFKNPNAIWAPEIHYLNDTWWIPHCMNGGGHGLLKSVSGLPEGPYISLAPIENKRIDGHLYQENGKTYYAWQADMMVELTEDLSAPTGEFIQLEHEGKHPLGYEGILLLKVDHKYIHIASGRYGYEPTNTYDLYYSVSDQLEGPYGKRKMAIKNAGHGNLFQDKAGNWWCTAFDHIYTDQWSLWLVPIEIKVRKNDIHFKIADPRFRPTKEDQAYIEELAKLGIPKEWQDKKPWYRPK